MAKIVTYFSRKTIIDYMMNFKNEKVVKTSICGLSDAVTSEFVKPVRALAYVISRRELMIDTITEGSVIRVPMLSISCDKIASVISVLESFLDSQNGQFELICFLRPSHFGIALVEYYSPENWQI